MNSRVQVFPLSNNGDNRGSSFSIPSQILSFVGEVGDIHLTTIAPGAIRGNHYHLRRREALIVLYSARWTYIGMKAKTVLPSAGSLQVLGQPWF